MRLDDEFHGSQPHRIAAYAPQSFTVGQQSINTSLIVSAEILVTDWAPSDIEQLELQHLEPAIDLAPEILILGTGYRQHRLSDVLTFDILSRQIGLEIMDTGAACRSYNLLLADDRKVIAALYLEGTGRP